MCVCKCDNLEIITSDKNVIFIVEEVRVFSDVSESTSIVHGMLDTIVVDKKE